MLQFTALSRRLWVAVALVLAAASVVPATAQVRTVDPNSAIDADLDNPGSVSSPATGAYTYPDNRSATGELEPVNPSRTVPPAPAPAVVAPQATTSVSPQAASPAAPPAVTPPVAAAGQGDTYKEDDLIGAAEGVFGKGAEGLARLIQDVLREQGEPNAYIVGREAGGAFVVGARYGSGTLHHKVEGRRPVYWTGPSVGLDAGANASSTFVLVYNLYDSQELYDRFPAGEGQAYLIGGFTASYLRKGDVVLIPIRVGAGLRLGFNAGYMRFSERQRWVPF